MKILNFFRRPYLAYTIAFMLLFVSCKKYDVGNKNESVLLSKKDYNKLLNKAKTLKLEIKEIKQNELKIDPIVYANQWLSNQNIVSNRDYNLDKNKLRYIYTNINIQYRGGNFNVLQYLQDQGLYSTTEINLITEFNNNIGTLSFQQNINNFTTRINQLNITTGQRNKLLLLSQFITLLNDTYQGAFDIQDDGYARFTWGCAGAALLLGVAVYALISSGAVVAALAYGEELSAIAMNNLIGSAIGYTGSLIGFATECFI